MNTDPIAEVPFTDGLHRPVYLDVDGRQYVEDHDGQRIYGTWIKPPEEEEPVPPPFVVADR